MNEIVFVPKHNWLSIILWGILFVLLGVAFSVGGIVIQNWFMIVFGSGFIFLGIFSAISRSTKIIIRDKDVVVKRLLFSDLVFQYRTFSGFTGDAFVFGARGILLKDILNSQEFASLFLKILEERNVEPTAKHNAEINRANLVIGYSVIPLVVISLIAAYLLKRYFNVQIDNEVIVGASLLLLSFWVFFVLIRKPESPNNP
jgi:hypothetical protein